jgi:hypothetical protein
MATTATKVHPFEAAGLGHAPFRFAGYSRAVFRAAPDAPAQCGASCDFCGTGIMDVFNIRSADGRLFKVGSDCVRRTYTEFDGSIPPEFRKAIADAEYEKREAKRIAAMERTNARADRARALLDARPDLLTDKPHPHPYHAGKGKTLRDYYSWLLENGFHAGKTDACRAIERAIDETPPGAPS